MTATTRDKMIAGAADLMSRRGVNATSMRDVVRHTATPRGSISHHFPDGKRQLIAEAVVFAGQQELYGVRLRARQREVAPLEVLPVVKPVNPLDLGPAAVLGLRPTVSVYTWDPRAGVWVRQPGSRPVRVQWGNTD